MNHILDRLLRDPVTPEPIDGVASWWARHQAATSALSDSIEIAMIGGFLADRPAWAFASAYQAALQRLLAEAALDRVGVSDPAGRKVAMCATEEGGNHPRAIQSTLVAEPGGGYRLGGHKRWATLGSQVEDLLVFASAGKDEQGRNRLAAVLVPGDRAGITITDIDSSEQPFVPEVAHARVELVDVRVEPHERLEGDGYDRYLKPFRTVEDCHVHAALLAWMLQVARRSSWSDDRLEAIVAVLAALHTIASCDPSSSATHIALAGAIALSDEILAGQEQEWQTVDEVTRTRWQRDQALLRVAGRARSRRREVAWQRIRD